ncbi:hypothetical protein DIU31_016800 [Mucilaginibacter rubeus]|uniref:Uncharacterized protein n=1 Tax=Mucilaginibacter rubeus TaxID=2027860 RepID=A0AAE6MIY1_9SPHI|nr:MULTISPECIES: hypothetical protein [Mucilaginibacter]QEM05091.1 hypothetical protein DIU31_016800 [Mucilaginibacter rubeus]QEM17683.1 hypothetical protein DIU38_016970 [Mucilaginibacter gossypii]QTE45791.1 hypothetical protein J3L19_10715 [Mucilaginibacter rubeus]QTE52388.1 hypothetical protein J3L21_10690 [Mucilaginibacter rubeus]QTE57477.1 hypothetical protein J3L23_02365 [Mucilaginibacter rubeus]
MKKFVCLAVAFFTSVLMFIAAGLFIKLSTSLMEPLVPARFFIIVLYSICSLKFALLVIMLMPDKPVLKQISIGFISADMFLVLPGSVNGLAISVPLPLIAIQALILLFYMALQGRLWLYKVNANTIENELMASPI